MSSSRKKTSIEIYEDDLPIIRAFVEHAESDNDADGIRFALNLMEAMLDEVKTLRAGAKPEDAYVKERRQRWDDAVLRRKLPFYG